MSGIAEVIVERDHQQIDEDDREDERGADPFEASAP